MRKRDRNAIANRFLVLAQRAEDLVGTIQTAGFEFEQNLDGVAFAAVAKVRAEDLTNDLAEEIKWVNDLITKEYQRNKERTYWRRFNKDLETL
jgi:hypothetical protein